MVAWGHQSNSTCATCAAAQMPRVNAWLLSPSRHRSSSGRGAVYDVIISFEYDPFLLSWRLTSIFAVDDFIASLLRFSSWIELNLRVQHLSRISTWWIPSRWIHFGEGGRERERGGGGSLPKNPDRNDAADMILLKHTSPAQTGLLIPNCRRLLWTCKWLMQIWFSHLHTAYGYSPVVRIPRGATNVRMTENSTNYIGKYLH